MQPPGVIQNLFRYFSFLQEFRAVCSSRIKVQVKKSSHIWRLELLAFRGSCILWVTDETSGDSARQLSVNYAK